MVYYTHDYEETEALGEKLGSTLKPGTVIAMFGDLGAGKTAFVRGLASGLEVSTNVKSPTFTIVDEHKGKLPLFHFDLYRISSYDELLDIGWEEYKERDGVCVVEWTENVPEISEEAQIFVKIESLGDNERKITVDGAEI